jgi:hypothetical protein
MQTEGCPRKSGLGQPKIDPVNGEVCPGVPDAEPFNRKMLPFNWKLVAFSRELAPFTAEPVPFSPELASSSCEMDSGEDSAKSSEEAVECGEAPLYSVPSRFAAARVGLIRSWFSPASKRTESGETCSEESVTSAPRNPFSWGHSRHCFATEVNYSGAAGASVVTVSEK